MTSAAELARREAERDGLFDRIRRIAKNKSAAFEHELASKAIVGPHETPLTGLSGMRQLVALFEREAVLPQLDGTAVPFATPLAVQTNRTSGHWVSGSGATPVVQAALQAVTLDPLKVANIAVLTRELVAVASPQSDARISRIIADSARTAVNATFLSADPADSGVSPAGILNGLTPLVSTGLGEGDLFEDLVALLYGMDRPVLIASLPFALRIRAALRDGGELVPVIVAPEAGDNVVAIDRAAIVTALGALNVLPSEHATIEMADDPSQPAQMTSMFQTNSVALCVTVFANWEVVDSDRVRVLDMGVSS